MNHFNHLYTLPVPYQGDVWIPNGTLYVGRSWCQDPEGLGGILQRRVTRHVAAAIVSCSEHCHNSRPYCTPGRRLFVRAGDVCSQSTEHACNHWLPFLFTTSDGHQSVSQGCYRPSWPPSRQDDTQTVCPSVCLENQIIVSVADN